MGSWLAVACGGALGAVGRFAIMRLMTQLAGTGFPYATLAVNVIGSFAMGVLVEVFALKVNPSAEVRAFLVIGVLGAFTTFSTFSLDAVALFERGATLAAGAYVALSVTLSIAGLLIGLSLSRSVLAGAV